MTKDEVIRMALEAGIIPSPGSQAMLERFAALVAAAEREACAKVADSQDGDDKGDVEECSWSRCARRIAHDIRARGEKQ
jgi:hypothetical protein